MASTRLYTATEMNLRGYTGTFTMTNSSNQSYWLKTDADNTSIVAIPIPKIPRTLNLDDPAVSVIAVTYSVATASLDAAPTAVLSKHSKHATTKVWTDGSVANALTFAGTNTAGTAAGTYDAIVTVTTPVRMTDLECLELELTFNAAATTVLTIFGMAVTTTGA